MDTRTWVSDEELKISLKGIVRGMEQEKHGQITYLLATVKMFLEEETKSLQSEKEEKVNLKAILRELEIARDSLNKDLESSTTMELEERQCQIVDLGDRLFDNVEEITCLEQKNSSLVAEMNNCTEENDFLQGRIREFEFDLSSLKKDLEYKDVRLLEFVESHLLENEKMNKDIESQRKIYD